MEKYQKKIDQQITFNKGKNIFYTGKDFPLQFIDDTINSISEIEHMDPESENILIDYTTDKALEEFCRINQYFTISGNAKQSLRKIYKDLFYSIRKHKDLPNEIAENHYSNLKQWLKKTNPFSEKLYHSEGQELTPIPCSEYSAELQQEILKIDDSIREPVLDIGCGKTGNLVKYLRNTGIKAFGIDRFTFSNEYLTNTNWLEYSYGTEKWGTIVSNLGFSNHFKHHDLREDGLYLEYARTYMGILKSLKIKGSFHYAPDLPFIELYLDKNKYLIEKYDVGNFDFKTSVITRIK